MDIEINKKVIEDALLWENRFLANINSEATVTSIKMVASDESSLTFSASNIETYAQCVKECHINSTGEVIVNGRAILEIVKLMPSESAVRLYTNSDDGRLHIESKKSKHSIPIVRTEIISQKFDESVEVAKLKVDSFVSLLDQIGIAVAKEDSTPVLTAVHLDFNENELVTTTIDRYRVAKKEIDIKSNTKDNIIFNAKFKTLSTIVNGLDIGNELAISYSEKSNQYSVESADKKSISSVINSDFPGTDELFSADFASFAIIDSNDLKQAINLASVLTDPTGGINLNFSENKVEITNNDDAHNAHEVIECEYKGEDITFKFNPIYVKEGIAKIGCEKLKFKFSESFKPAEVVGFEKDKEVTDYRYIAVPIRNI